MSFPRFPRRQKEPEDRLREAKSRIGRVEYMPSIEDRLSSARSKLLLWVIINLGNYAAIHFLPLHVLLSLYIFLEILGFTAFACLAWALFDILHVCKRLQRSAGPA